MVDESSEIVVRCAAYLATSLDGYIAADDGDVGWLDLIPMPEGSDFGWAEFMAPIDVLVLGRNSYEKVLTFDPWPYELPVIVMSSTLSTVDPKAINTEIVDMTPRELVAELGRRGATDVYVDGGRLITSFLVDGLLDELIVTQAPVVLGGGIPLFGPLDEPVWMDLVGAEVFGDPAPGHGVLQFKYRRRPSDPGDGSD